MCWMRNFLHTSSPGLKNLMQRFDRTASIFSVGLSRTRARSFTSAFAFILLLRFFPAFSCTLLTGDCINSRSTPSSFAYGDAGVRSRNCVIACAIAFVRPGQSAGKSAERIESSAKGREERGRLAAAKWSAA